LQLNTNRSSGCLHALKHDIIALIVGIPENGNTAELRLKLFRALPEKNESGGIPLRARIRFKNRAGRQASMRWGSRIQRICVNA